LLLSENKAITSESSVVINTNEEGVPESSPTILNIKANDQTRIHVTWKPGNKNNGPIISYILQIRDLTQSGYTATKVLTLNHKVQAKIAFLTFNFFFSFSSVVSL
jgi:hypothetical protein